MYALRSTNINQLKCEWEITGKLPIKKINKYIKHIKHILLSKKLGNNINNVNKFYNIQ